jgi:hypothetical protein
VNALESGKISPELVLAANSGYHSNLLTSSLIRVVHIGDISKLGWLIDSFATAMWAASLYPLDVFCKTKLYSNILYILHFPIKNSDQ